MKGKGFKGGWWQETFSPVTEKEKFFSLQKLNWHVFISQSAIFFPFNLLNKMRTQANISMSRWNYRLCRKKYMLLGNYLDCIFLNRYRYRNKFNPSWESFCITVGKSLNFSFQKRQFISYTLYVWHIYDLITGINYAEMLIILRRGWSYWKLQAWGEEGMFLKIWEGKKHWMMNQCG